MEDFRQLEALVIQWAEARRIIPNATMTAQARKTVEEAVELLEAAVALDTLTFPHSFLQEQAKERAKDAYIDGCGDVAVTLIIGCKLLGVDPLDCLRAAYETIKDRTGTLLEDGTFVKDRK